MFPGVHTPLVVASTSSFTLLHVTQERKLYAIYEQGMPRSVCTLIQYKQSLFFSLIYSTVSIDYATVQRGLIELRE